MDNLSSLMPNCTQLDGVPEHLFMALINILVAAKCSFPSPEKDYPPDYGPKLTDEEEFDFIVVGAGTAGSVMASRLSEIEDWKVLLLEAGGYPSSATEVPSLLFSLQGTEEDWQYVTEPSSTCCLGSKNQRCIWPRGKTLGGSSALNVMLYLRGNKNDYDRWEKMGNEGWNYDSVLKYFKKVEKLVDESLKKHKVFGEEGYLTLSKTEVKYTLKKSIKQAAKEIGLSTPEFESSLGFFDALLSIENGLRCSAAKAYLGKVKNRQNLYVATKAYVKKVLFQSNTKKASGVEVFINGKTLKLRAKKEVILSAGSINSPHVLMNSGIGPKDHLAKHEIPLVQNLPVGKNLQDHMNVHLLIELDEDFDGNKQIADHLFNYFVHRKGPIGAVSLTNSIGFVNTKNDSGYPNIQYIPIFIPKTDLYLKGEIHRCFGLNDAQIRKEREILEHRDILRILVINTYPESRGRIELKSNNPFDKPLIHPGYFTDPDGSDLQTMVEGIRLFKKIIETSAFKKHDPKIIKPASANCKHHKFDSDDYWKCIIKDMSDTTYHPAGTCKMGPKEDSTSVVSSRLAVHGVDNLRVIDASIMPKIVSVNLNGPTYMIAEKGADFIKEDWLKVRDEL